MPVALCPRCQTPLVAQTPYLRIYVRDEDEHESYIRIHLECPVTQPNLASAPPPPPGDPTGTAQSIQGGGVAPRPPGPRVVLAAAAALAGLAVKRAKSRR